MTFFCITSYSHIVWIPPFEPRFAAEDMSGSADAPAQSGGSFIETHSSRRVGWVIEGITQKLKEYPKGSRMVSLRTRMNNIEYY